MSRHQLLSEIQQILKPIYGESEAKSIARIILEDVSDESKIPTVLNKLLAGQPIQYILGLADFYGLKFQVNPNVLIPRPETEELVYWILEDFKYSQKDYTVLDIGTGSGCIPITLKSKFPNWKITALDKSPRAIEVAKQNAIFHKVDIKWLEVNFLDESQWKILPNFDIIISNPPYIPFKEKQKMPDLVLKNEPHLALFVKNDDPLIFYKKIAEFSKQKLTPSGQCYVEINEAYGAESIKVFENNNFKTIELQKDMQGKDRMIKATFR